MALIKAKNLIKTFKLGESEFRAVNDVSINIEQGETYGLVGESACGKSTIALSILALQSVDSGVVEFDGVNILTMQKKIRRSLRRNIRMLFQNPEAVLNSGMTLQQVLMEELEKEKKLSKKEKITLMHETIGQVGLSDLHLARFPAGLSTGEKQRAAIARAIITRPKFLICDEPVASLDLSLKSGIIDLLMDLQKRLGLTYLYISHNLALVRKMAHKIGIMYMGNLVEEAPAQTFSVFRVLHPYSKLLLASVPSTYPDEYQKILTKYPDVKDLPSKLPNGFKQRYHDILKDYPDVEPTRLPGGCPFRNRCPFYFQNPLKDCETTMPSLRDHGDGRKAACHQIKGLVYKGMRTTAV
ncbi:MAG: ABC transporter ATP-binding protein [Fibrobacteria bacterium]|nr:ABC transporter ATP-binding protein [Fibrobacteria bacterium]